MSHPALNAAVRLYLKAKGLPIKKPKIGARWIPGAIFAYERGPDRFVLVQVQDALGTVKTLTRTYGPEELTKRLMLTAAAAMQLRANPKRFKATAKKKVVRKRKKAGAPKSVKTKPTSPRRRRKHHGLTRKRKSHARRTVPYGAKVIFV